MYMKWTILVIDDEENIRNGLETNFEMEDYNVRTASNGKTALELLEKGDIDLVVTDLRMDGISGEEIVRHVATKMPGIPVIVLTGHGSIDAAVDAMKNGAFDFLTKPLNLDHLNQIVKRALEGRNLSLEHNRLQKELDGVQSFDHMIGKSPEMQKVFNMVKKVASSRASVLITGESGVGKELVANAIHNLSGRKESPLIKVHLAAVNENLIESELFGHEKGAFTGATTLQKGVFELAHGGTIFLDEIGEINQSTQVKILRVLQERTFERVGGEQSINVDVRIVAATNRNLEEEVKLGRFREDLFYRLNVIHIHVPPLRERKDDIPLLIDAFLKKFSTENQKKVIRIEQRAKTLLFNYDWPGNIRQLQNCIESAVVICNGDEITMEDLPPSITNAVFDETIPIPVGISLEEAEKTIIVQNLAANNGNKTKTAEILGIERKTLHRKLEKYGLSDNSLVDE